MLSRSDLVHLNVLLKMTNKEINDHFTAKLFSELYVSHPVPINFEITDEKDTKEVKVYSMRFLKENNYLKFEWASNGYFDVRFTDRGLALLELPSEGGDEKVGESLVTAIKDGSISVAAGILSHILITGATN